MINKTDCSNTCKLTCLHPHHNTTHPPPPKNTRPQPISTECRSKASQNRPAQMEGIYVHILLILKRALLRFDRCFSHFSNNNKILLPSSPPLWLLSTSTRPHVPLFLRDLHVLSFFFFFSVKENNKYNKSPISSF